MLAAENAREEQLLQSKLAELVTRFRESIKSDVTPDGWLDFIHAYMRHWMIFDYDDDNDSEEDPQQRYRYDWLLSTAQGQIEHFVLYKKKQGLGASGLDNYINSLKQFLWINGVKAHDWDVIRSFRPERVKKTKDREYFSDEVIAIEGKLDDRGRCISGLMRGSGVRRGAEPTIEIGDIFARQTKYGKIYKMWVYRGTKDEYPTACIPEVARRIDTYQAYRLLCGEVCPQFETDHYHDYYDGVGDSAEVIHKFYKAGERHLDPHAPLIREDFNKKDEFAARRPRKISYEQISEIVRNAAIDSGIRVPNKGDPYKRHKTMITHGFRKLFKKRCRRDAKMDPIILERFMGHKSGNPKDGITQLMMTYDPEDWAEMEGEFVKAIPHLTINRDAQLEAALKETEKKLHESEKENEGLKSVIQKRLEAVEHELAMRGG